MLMSFVGCDIEDVDAHFQGGFATLMFAMFHELDARIFVVTADQCHAHSDDVRGLNMPIQRLVTPSNAVNACSIRS